MLTKMCGVYVEFMLYINTQYSVVCRHVKCTVHVMWSVYLIGNNVAMLTKGVQVEAVL